MNHDWPIHLWGLSFSVVVALVAVQTPQWLVTPAAPKTPTVRITVTTTPPPTPALPVLQSRRAVSPRALSAPRPTPTTSAPPSSATFVPPPEPSEPSDTLSPPTSETAPTVTPTTEGVASDVPSGLLDS